ncbi:hypothetical protein DPEC_G00291210 [Dallia pectoralis]|uniref:Uncharacterized protein n=1 Tax=Dallia pectoralis TaxID=75939 RepID=A0ACC2FHR1_DALPE|nr:hypothetical protein DPEC_G00291210 [Dallia pectoralis]
MGVYLGGGVQGGFSTWEDQLPQTFELGLTGGAPNFDSSKMADMSVEDITLRANQVTDESLESTRRMLQMAQESNETGAKTSEMLSQQGEQLKRTEQGMDQINQDMKQAEKNLTDLSKCCGLCVCPCDRVTSIERDAKYKRTWEKGETGSSEGDRGAGHVVSRQPTSVQNGPGANQQEASGARGPYIKRITNDHREEEMEENLDQVGSIIGNLKNMAMDMGGELDKQNHHIDRITAKADMNKARIDDANQRANKLIK